MCGIYGKVFLDGRMAHADDARRACGLMRHRGPDDAGVFSRGPAAMGHVRLSVIDLSPMGHQPMSNEDGSLWIVFNGEIYNFLQLRAPLEAKGHIFRSRTDTEVILHLFEEEGEACVERLRGMFAFAIWSERTRRLFLARDRIGKKPLFYHHGDRAFTFCSELAPLVSDPDVPSGVDRVAIHHYLTLQSVPAPWTAFRHVSKLPPAHTLALRDGTTQLRRYWKLSFTPKLTVDSVAARERIEAELLDKLRESVRIRLRSDVPIGALLSGGIDSSGVVALMCESGPVQTFSVGFDHKEYDELPYAREVARQYATEHRELIVRADMLAVLPLLVRHFGEPFADSAAIPTYYVSKIAREHVTVALCGDGGDESFAGYERYRLNALLRGFDVVPRFIPRVLFRLLRLFPQASNLRNPLWLCTRFFQHLSRSPEVRALRFRSFFDDEQKTDLYTSEFTEEMAGHSSDDVVLRHYNDTDADNLLDATLYAEINTYLPDTLLPKVDITSMATSLEMRSPLLDHELMELAAKLPADLKLRRLQTKYILRKVLAPLLPNRILSRPKRGFGVPLDHWFRGELRDMVRETLLSRRALDRGYFRAAAVTRILDEQDANRWHWHHHIYSLLMLELWHREFIDR